MEWDVQGLEYKGTEAWQVPPAETREAEDITDEEHIRFF